MDKIVRTQVRLPADLADWIKDRARDEERSMNAQIVQYLKEARRSHERPSGDDSAARKG